MQTIIGNYKEYLIIERKELDKIQKMAEDKIEKNKERPMSEAVIEAKAILQLINEVKELNIYNNEFQIKG